jgi:hypothetical protein
MHTQHWARFMFKVQTNADSFSFFKRISNFGFNLFLKFLKEPLVPIQGLNYAFDKTFNPILNLVFHNQL